MKITILEVRGQRICEFELNYKRPFALTVRTATVNAT